MYSVLFILIVHVTSMQIIHMRVSRRNVYHIQRRSLHGSEMNGTSHTHSMSGEKNLDKNTFAALANGFDATSKLDTMFGFGPPALTDGSGASAGAVAGSGGGAVQKETLDTLAEISTELTKASKELQWLYLPPSQSLGLETSLWKIHLGLETRSWSTDKPLD